MNQNHNYFVYILECIDGSYYTGVTNNLEQRLWQHNDGINKDCFTFKRRPVVLRYYQHFQQITEAIKWEKQLKGWSRRKKQALLIVTGKELSNLLRRIGLRQAQPDISSYACKYIH